MQLRYLQSDKLMKRFSYSILCCSYNNAFIIDNICYLNEKLISKIERHFFTVLYNLFYITKECQYQKLN